MAQILEYTINIVGNAVNITDKLCRGLEKTGTQVSKLNKGLDVMGRLSLGLTSLVGSVNSCAGAFREFAAVNEMQQEAETKLAQVMRNTMGATREEWQAIKDLTAAQQQLGIVGDEVQLAGAQELGTYLTKTENLQKLIPVMNNMVAQQYGYNATQESAVNIATMMGKVMDGQVGALSRYGYKFDEAQEKILKFGTEEQRAATLADVVNSAVGGVNEALARTPEGKMKQLSNSIGDVKEKIGSYVTWIVPFQQMLTPITQIISVTPALQTIIGSMGSAVGKIGALGSSAMLALKKQIVSVALSAQLSGGAMKLFGNLGASACRKIGVAIMNIPIIGWIAAGVAALMALFKMLWDRSENFRIVVFTIWEGIKAVFNNIWEWLTRIGTWINENIIQPIVNFFSNIGNWIREAFSSVFNWIEEKLTALTNWMGKHLGGIFSRGKAAGEASWNASQQQKLEQSVNSPWEAATNTSTPSTSEGTSAVATGGTRNTDIHINIGDMIKTVNFNGTTGENKQEIERNFAECLYRVLGMAQVSVG